MKSKKISWYQTGIISLIGIFLLGNWAIEKEVARRDLKSIQINIPKNTRHKGLSLEFDLTSIDLLKSKPQINVPIDSLQKVGSVIREYRQKYDTTHVLTVFWAETTRLQQVVTLLDTLKNENQHRYSIIPNDTKCMIAFYFPKPNKEFIPVCGTSFLEPYYSEPSKTIQQNFDMIFKDYIGIWVLYGVLIVCVFWKWKKFMR